MEGLSIVPFPKESSQFNHRLLLWQQIYTTYFGGELFLPFFVLLVGYVTSIRLLSSFLKNYVKLYKHSSSPQVVEYPDSEKSKLLGVGTDSHVFNDTIQ